MSDSINNSAKETNELYVINNDYLDKLNNLRRKLNLVELEDKKPKSEKDEINFHLSDSSLRTDDEIVEIPSDISAHLSRKGSAASVSSNKIINYQTPSQPIESKLYNTSSSSLVNKNELSTISESPNSIASSNFSQLKYQPAVKKVCRRMETVSSENVNEVMDIIPLDLKSLNEKSCESISLQCNSVDLEKKDYSSSSGGFEFISIDQRARGDSANLKKCQGTHLVPEVIIKRAAEVNINTTTKASPRCLKFLPIAEDKDVFNESKECDKNSSSLGSSGDKGDSPNGPMWDNYLNTEQCKIKPKKKKLKRKHRNNRIGCGDYNLDDADSLTTATYFTKKSPLVFKPIKDKFEEDSYKSIGANYLRTSLAVPLLTSHNFQFPAITKLSEFIDTIKNKETVDDFEVDLTLTDSVAPIRRERFLSKLDPTPVRKVYSKSKCRFEDAKSEFGFKEKARMLVKSSISSNEKRSKNQNHDKRKPQCLDIDYYNVENCLPKSGSLDSESVHPETGSNCFNIVEKWCCFKKLFCIK